MREDMAKLKEMVDKVYVRLEQIEKIVARVRCSGSDSWKYNFLDVLEQIYDILSEIRKKLEGLENA